MVNYISTLVPIPHIICCLPTTEASKRWSESIMLLGIDNILIYVDKKLKTFETVSFSVEIRLNLSLSRNVNYMFQYFYCG